VASPLVTAMIRGGIAILDEGNRMSEKSWASLAPLLDNRRYVESIVAGIKIKAHPQFRLVATMNDDASTFELPEYIHSRLQPQIFIDFPERDEEYRSCARTCPSPKSASCNTSPIFCKGARADERYTVRDGINVARFAIKLKSLATQRTHEPRRWKSPSPRLGEEALRYVRRNGLPIPDPAACGAAGSPTSRWRPAAWSSPIEVRQAILRERPQVVALELPVSLQQAWMRAVGRCRRCR
jgi:MoxR-like ATPase